MVGKTQKNKTIFPLILVILDGWGVAPQSNGNAITLAGTPTINGVFRKYPSLLLGAHGRGVGLPANQVGNSEAGHMNIGAGRIVEQDAVRISKSINNGTFQKNSAFHSAIRHVRKMKSKLHLVGMLSNGQSPHSDPDHLIGLLTLMRNEGIKDVYIHLFTDGRDSPKYAALKIISNLERCCGHNYKLATIMGRFYAMDRKKSWDRTEKAYLSLIEGKGRLCHSSDQAIMEAYNRGESDEYIEPTVIGRSAKEGRIGDDDAIIFFNLRSDRARQLAKVFVQTDFSGKNPGAFKRRKLANIFFVALTDFGPDLDDIITAYPGIDLNNTLPMVLSGYSQAYIAETEKYAHVTYFFNGGYTGTVNGEKQLMAPSPNVKSYDQTPDMSSEMLKEIVMHHLVPKMKGEKKPKTWQFDFTVLNLAAPDMIGHTGNLKAGIECCRKIDAHVKEIVDAYLKLNGTVILTADHGNIEQMINYKTGEIFTEHTMNPVPFVIINKALKNNIKLKKQGVLGDIAPTILDLLGVKKPKEMTGQSLIK